MSTDLHDKILEVLRELFPPEAVGKKPKLTCRACSKADGRCCDKHRLVKCRTCGNYISNAHTHLDYVGHAHVTDRLLDSDPRWNWEPMAVQANGAPAFDEFGGIWIKLTIADVTRIGYGHPDGKRGGDAVKEAVGDAIRNAAMRFGVGLDLWKREPVASEGVEAERPARQQQQPGPDPVEVRKEELRKQILAVGQQRGWDVEAVAREFGAKYGGRKFTEASVATLVDFQGHLKQLADTRPS